MLQTPRPIMKRRIYNILFHTHTISGIIISVALYVIFFAGSLSFFRDEIANWEQNSHTQFTDHLPADIDAYLKTISETHPLQGREVEFTHYYNEPSFNVNISASADSLAPKKLQQPSFFYLNTNDYTTSTYLDNYGLGEFLYRLHFLDQIPYPYGRYLSGFVALFFLFALFTGIWIHWDKIVSNFYTFRPLAKLKTVWTDAHTALGLIGFPFQFVYALTGAFFLLKGILMLPLVYGLYGGDQNKLYEDLEYSHPHFDYTYTPLNYSPKINPLIEKTLADWPDFQLTEVHIFNHGDANMHVSLSGNTTYSKKFSGYGYRIYKVADQSITHQKVPKTNNTYLDGAKTILYRLHLGDYGGLALRFISFILGLISCVVIISGILIWLVARNKKNIPEKRRRFNHWVANSYMAICLSMLPVTALTFIVTKIYGVERSLIFKTYFINWLLLSLFFTFKRNINFTNKWCLATGGILSLVVPFTNWLSTGNWPWISVANQYTEILFIDLLFLGIGLIASWVGIFKIKFQSKIINT